MISTVLDSNLTPFNINVYLSFKSKLQGNYKILTLGCVSISDFPYNFSKQYHRPPELYIIGFVILFTYKLLVLVFFLQLRDQLMFLPGAFQLFTVLM